MKIRRTKQLSAAESHKPCMACGIPVKKRRQRYCDKTCMANGYKLRMKGSHNLNFRDRGNSRKICACCGSEFKPNYAIRTRVYCSHNCYVMNSKHKVRKDNNHGEIIEFCKSVGCLVADLSPLGNGCPDVLLSFRGKIFLVEIKNPRTSYGRRGLNKNQKKFAECWPVNVVRTTADVVDLLGIL